MTYLELIQALRRCKSLPNVIDIHKTMDVFEYQYNHQSNWNDGKPSRILQCNKNVLEWLYKQIVL